MYRENEFTNDPAVSGIKTHKMKKTIFTITITIFAIGILLTGCQSSAEKVENARDNVQDAKDNVVVAQQELNQALNDSILQFKKESMENINAYEKSIAEFKTKIATEKKETRAIYEKKISELEQKNNQMKTKLEEYKDNGQEAWVSFKAEFNHDMNELGEAFKDLTVDNKK